MILSTTDFATGYVKISQNQNTIQDLQTYITTAKENSYIKDILGVELGEAFIADLSGDPSEPITAKFQLIFDFFTFSDHGLNEKCIGLKEILKYLVYNDYTSQQKTLNQAGGNSRVQTEASIDEGLVDKTTFIYNRAAMQICSLQYFVSQDPVLYPGYYGQLFLPNSPI